MLPVRDPLRDPRFFRNLFFKIIPIILVIGKIDFEIGLNLVLKFYLDKCWTKNIHQLSSILSVIFVNYCTYLKFGRTLYLSILPNIIDTKIYWSSIEKKLVIAVTRCMYIHLRNAEYDWDIAIANTFIYTTFPPFLTLKSIYSVFDYFIRKDTKTKIHIHSKRRDDQHGLNIHIQACLNNIHNLLTNFFPSLK